MSPIVLEHVITPGKRVEHAGMKDMASWSLSWNPVWSHCPQPYKSTGSITSGHRCLVFTLNLLLSTLSWLQPLMLWWDIRNLSQSWGDSAQRWIMTSALAPPHGDHREGSAGLCSFLKQWFHFQPYKREVPHKREVSWNLPRNCFPHSGPLKSGIRLPQTLCCETWSVLIRALAYLVFIGKHRQCPTRWFRWCLHTHTHNSTGGSPSRSCSQMRAVSLCPIHHLQKSH